MVDNIEGVGKPLLLLVLAVMQLSCIEPFEAKFEDFESALVFEAVITDEMKRHEVRITRTYEFEDDSPSPESKANVSVEDNSGNMFAFNETEPGVYVSQQPFSAEAGRTYRLRAITQDGRSYSSSAVEMPKTTGIDDVTATRITNDDGTDGIAILVNTFDPTGSSLNYRYEYEETYKIIAPKYNDKTLEIVNSIFPDCEARIVPREVEERVCFATNLSNRIIQTSTSDLEEDRVSNFMIRFLANDDFIITHRYSILVKQFIQSNLSYSFYETLNELAGNESILSENQPGFLPGNVSSDLDRNEKVLGFFDVSATDEKRIFFNYRDFYPTEPLPPFVNPCREVSPLVINFPPGLCPLIRQLELDIVEFISENEGQFPLGGPFIVVPRECGDCTALGSNVVPDFWSE